MSANSVVEERKLARVADFVIAKAVIESLFVAALALGFYLNTFNPFFRGWVDEANRERVAGWAVNLRAPDARVEVQLYIDGNFVASRKAEAPRPDLVEAGRARDPLHGFSFETPALSRGQHEARVYAVHASNGDVRRTMQLVGKPLLFTVD